MGTVAFQHVLLATQNQVFAAVGLDRRRHLGAIGLKNIRVRDLILNDDKSRHFFPLGCFADPVTTAQGLFKSIVEGL
mgnify:CR=1 FL=1